jgi:hypothetical protein
MPRKRKLVEDFHLDFLDLSSPLKCSKPAVDKDINQISCQKTILIVLPGASGSLSKNMRTVMMPKLSQSFKVVVRTGKWRGWNPNSNENVSSVLDLCPKDGSSYYILGNSFGNRVLCALYVGEHFASHHVPAPAGVIICGYPMYGEKYTEERVSAFLSMPSGVRMCCISGSNDVFLHRCPPKARASKAILKGESMYQFVIKSRNVRPEPVLHIIPGGGHGVIDVAKSKLENVTDEVLNIIEMFVV